MAESAGSHRLLGEVVAGFENVQAHFARLLKDDAEFSGQLSAYWRGRKVIDIAGGPYVRNNSIAGVFSVSKGASALAISLLVQSGLLELDRPVAYYWPAFSAEGKGSVTVRQLLTHQAGLIGTRDGLTLEDLCDSRDAAKKLAASAPWWHPGSMFGYHALTMGVLMEELCRRTDGRSLQEIYAKEIRDPYGIDFYLGVPAEEESRVLPILPRAERQVSLKEENDDSLIGLAMGVIREGRMDTKLDYLANDPAVRRSGVAAVGGVGSAEGLARLYAAAVTGVDGREPFLGSWVIGEMTREQVWGLDRVLNVQMCFGVVFMKPHPHMQFASYQGFGHDGAGGALGFADPKYGLAVGYIPQRMSGSETFVELSNCIRQCVIDMKG
ncbi:MAG: serine hydrolase domain-containing protein [Ferrimicrobium sp.]